LEGLTGERKESTMTTSTKIFAIIGMISSSFPKAGKLPKATALQAGLWEILSTIAHCGAKLTVSTLMR
jgi:hypothetical protein